MLTTDTAVSFGKPQFFSFLTQPLQCSFHLLSGRVRLDEESSGTAFAFLSILMGKSIIYYYFFVQFSHK